MRNHMVTSAALPQCRFLHCMIPKSGLGRRVKATKHGRPHPCPPVPDGRSSVWGGPETGPSYFLWPLLCWYSPIRWKIYRVSKARRHSAAVDTHFRDL